MNGKNVAILKDEKTIRKACESLGDDVFVDVRLSTGVHGSKRVVGIGFTDDERYAYYVPLREEDEKNETGKETVLDCIEKKNVVSFGCKDWVGIIFKERVQKKIEDLQLISWLKDTNEKRMDFVNVCEREGLNVSDDMEEFIFNDNNQLDFDDVKLAQNSHWFMTNALRLRTRLLCIKEKFGEVCRIDAESIQPVADMELSGIRIDKEGLALRLNEVNYGIKMAEREVERHAGRKVNLNSVPDIIRVLKELSVPTNKLMEGGKVSTASELLERIVEDDDVHPIVGAIIRFRENMKMKMSCIEPLNKYMEKKDRAHFQYKMTAVPTGRLSSGKAKDTDFFAPMNIQSVPKPRKADGFVHSFVSGKDVAGGDFLGFVFTKKEQEGKNLPIEGHSEDMNVRNLFLPEEGAAWVSFDMKAEELRIAANMMREKQWIVAFEQGKDVHTEMAMKLFGGDGGGAEGRAKAKTCFHSGTWFQTQDGFVRGYEIGEGDNLVDLEGNEQENIIVKNTISERTYTVSTDNGLTCTVTGDHEFQVFDGSGTIWKKAEQLKRGDFIIYRKNYIYGKDYKKIGNYKVDEDLGYFLGYVSGKIEDTDGRAKLIGTKRILDMFVKKGYLFEGIHSRLNLKKSHNFVKEDLVEAMGGWRGFNSVPKEIMQSPKSVMEAYLAGVVDSLDVRYYPERYELMYLKKGHQRLSEDIAFMFNVCGYIVHGYHSMTYEKPADKIMRHTGRKKKNGALLTQDRFFVSDFTGNKWTRTTKAMKVRPWSENDYIAREIDIRNYRCGCRYDFETFERYGVIEESIGTMHLSEENTSAIYDGLVKEGYRIGMVSSVRRKESPTEILVVQTSTHMYRALGYDSKNCSFGILYGMGPSRLMAQTGMGKEEASDFLERFRKNLPSLCAEQEKWIEKAKKEGEVRSFFGRPRKVGKWLNSEDKDERMAGERIVLNDPIQGTAGDILKIMMRRVWENVIRNEKYRGKVRMLSVIHDEINFSISKEILQEAIEEIKKNMTYEMKGCPVKLECSVSIGNNWGDLHEFEYCPMDLWVPVLRS